MITLPNQLEKLYREGGYRERLLDIENKRQEYRNQNRNFSRLRIIIIAAYVVLFVNGMRGISLLLSRQSIFIGTFVVLLAGIGLYTLWKGWESVKQKIISFRKICVSLILLLIELIVDFRKSISSSDRAIERFSSWEKSILSIVAIACSLFGVILIYVTRLLFVYPNIFVSALVANLVILITGTGLHFILNRCLLAKQNINSALLNYYSVLLEFRSEAVTSFTKIIQPEAKNIQFIAALDFRFSNSDNFGVKESGLFYNNFERYGESNVLTFSIDGLTYQVGEVELIFAIESSFEAIEFDRFVEMGNKNSKLFGIFQGNFYKLPFLKAKRSSTYLIPKNATQTPLITTQKTVKGWDGKFRDKTVQVSQQYPWLELSGRASQKSPDRFKRLEFEKYNMENDMLEDNFHTFGKEENATRKLLDYSFMERIVELFPNPNESRSKNKFLPFFQPKDTDDSWFAIQREKLLIARQQQNLRFFTQIGEQSADFDNVLANFSKLQSILQVIEQLDLFRANAQEL